MRVHVSNKVFLVAFVMAAFHVAVSDAANMTGNQSLYAQGSSITDTMMALDTNRNGKVDRSELEAFARSQGLSAQDMAGDFKDIDSNGDGELDVSEIAKLLRDMDAQQSAAASTRMEPSVNAPPSVTSESAIPDTSNAFDAPAAVAATPVKLGNEPEAFDAPAVVAAAPDKPSVMQPALKEATAPSTLEVFTHSNIEIVQQNAAQQAGRVVATSFANRAQQLMQQSASDEKSAIQYAREARALRGKVQELVQSAKGATRLAAVEATTHVTNHVVPQVQQLQLELQKIQKEADHERTLAHQAMHQAAVAQSMMAKLFQRGGAV